MDLPPPTPAVLVVDSRCALAEGPAWFFQRLWWVDIHGNAIHEFDPASGTHTKHDTGRRVTVVVPASDGRFVIAGDDGVVVTEHPTKTGEQLAEFPEAGGETRFNDGKCDAQGRLWVGTMGLKAQPGAGSLYRLGRGARVLERMIPDVTISNGMTWSGDNRTMYYIDTPTQKVDAFDFDPSTGSISGRRTMAVMADSAGHPDGMTIDREGFVWVALWGGWSVVRINPSTGEIVERVGVPVEQVSSCCFGGDDLSELYITTAGGTNRDKAEPEPHAGGIFRYRPSVGGMPPHTFELE